jgi:hypothetical protein
MPSNKYPWQKVFDSVLQESNPIHAFRMFECALSALQVRLAELGEKPAKEDEQKAIFEAIAAMRKRLSAMQADLAGPADEPIKMRKPTN